MKIAFVGLSLAAVLCLGLWLVWPPSSENSTKASAAGDTQNEPAVGAPVGSLVGEESSRRAGQKIRPPLNPVQLVVDLPVDQSLLRKAMNAVVGCVSCVSGLESILQTPSYGLDQRLAAAELLAASGTEEGTLALLRALVDAQRAGESELQQELLHTLANLDSERAAAALVEFLSIGPELLEISPEVLTFVQKVLANMSAQSRVGRLLREAYGSVNDPAIRERFDSFKNPELEAALLAQAWRQGDDQEAAFRLDRLLGNDTPQALEGLMLLAAESDLPLERLSELTFQWAQDSRQGEVFDRLVEHLTRFDANATERSLAAWGLAGLGRDAEPALRKALSYETDPLMVDQLQEALSSLAGDKP